MLMLTETDGFTRRSVNKVNVNAMAYSNNHNSNMLRRPSDQRMGTHHLPKINKMSVEKQQTSNSRKPVMKMNN